jgi:hypothetical protein
MKVIFSNDTNKNAALKIKIGLLQHYRVHGKNYSYTQPPIQQTGVKSNRPWQNKINM